MNLSWIRFDILRIQRGLYIYLIDYKSICIKFFSFLFDCSFFHLFDCRECEGNEMKVGILLAQLRRMEVNIFLSKSCLHFLSKKTWLKALVVAI